MSAATVTSSWAAADMAPCPAATFSQTPDGFQALEAQLAATSHTPAATLVVLEATGSYGVASAVHLHTAGYQLSVVTPRHGHASAQSRSRRAKTDARDAQRLVQFAQERRPGGSVDAPTGCVS